MNIDAPIEYLEEYEYGVQSKWRDEWHMMTTNHFSGWYPSEASAKNALAQKRAQGKRYGGYHAEREFRLVRRPVGPVEVING